MYFFYSRCFRREAWYTLDQDAYSDGGVPRDDISGRPSSHTNSWLWGRTANHFSQNKGVNPNKSTVWMVSYFLNQAHVHKVKL